MPSACRNARVRLRLGVGVGGVQVDSLDQIFQEQRGLAGGQKSSRAGRVKGVFSDDVQ